MSWKWIFLMALAILIVIFTMQNIEVVEFRFLFFTLKISRALVIFLTFCSGIVAGWMTILLKRDKKR